MEGAFRAEPSLCDTAAAFLKEIRKDPVVNHGNVPGVVGNHKVRRQAVAVMFQASFDNQTSETKLASHRRFLREHLGRREIEHQTPVECIEHERGRQRQAAETENGEEDSSMPPLHDCDSPLGCLLRWMALRRRTSVNTSANSAAKVSA